jgi:hypothetical protein
LRSAACGRAIAKAARAAHYQAIEETAAKTIQE